MALERKVYVSWAFTENWEEKRDINREIYLELTKKYKVCKYPKRWNPHTKKLEDVNMEEYDIVLQGASGYAHMLYKVLKNNTNLSGNEMALICDDGNLCFGYTMDGGAYHIFTD